MNVKGFEGIGFQAGMRVESRVEYRRHKIAETQGKSMKVVGERLGQFYQEMI